MAHMCSPNTWEVEAGESVVQGHVWLYSQIEANLIYVRLHFCQKQTKQQILGNLRTLYNRNMAISCIYLYLYNVYMSHIYIIYTLSTSSIPIYMHIHIYIHIHIHIYAMTVVNMCDMFLILWIQLFHSKTIGTICGDWSLSGTERNFSSLFRFPRMYSKYCILLPQSPGESGMH